MKTGDISLNNLSIFFWNMSPAGTTPNGNGMYLYLPNGHENVVKYDDCLYNFRRYG